MHISGGGSKGKTQDFELNLASIIDCLTVLITFMLATASFLSIGLFEAGVASSTGTSTPAPIEISVTLGVDGSYDYKVSGKTSAHRGHLEVEALKRELTQVQKQFPTVQSVTLAAEDSVSYEKVILAMSEIRNTHPAVLLGGF